MGWVAHRKWKEIKQVPSMLPGTAVPGCSLVSFHFLWAILCPQAVQCIADNGSAVLSNEGWTSKRVLLSRYCQIGLARNWIIIRNALYKHWYGIPSTVDNFQFLPLRPDPCRLSLVNTLSVLELSGAVQKSFSFIEVTLRFSSEKPETHTSAVNFFRQLKCSA